MGCLGAALAALLALAVPASIAPASLIGAYVVLVLLAALAAALVVANARRRPGSRIAVGRGLAWVGGLTIAYAAVATVIHVAT